MKSRELINLGLPRGPILRRAQEAIGAARTAGRSREAIREALRSIAADPGSHADDPHFGAVAATLLEEAEAGATFRERPEPAPWRRWGDDLEPESVKQLENACRLPVAVAGALMPDAHVGYGLPIGGVLATANSVIPYAVGVDIACRMKMSVLDVPASALSGQADRLIGAIERETRFGVGAKFRRPHDHPVLEEEAWSTTRESRHLREKAREQLGTSGSGNHFVEFGVLTLETPDLGLDAGEHLALLSHSGSRGAGAAIASRYSRLAMERHPELPKELRHLAWLDLEEDAGREYWRLMNLMGEYAAANHAVIHDSIARHLGARIVAGVENHHNFAWKETHDGREVIVHRKGATPAGEGVLGVIPGSMASPAFVVRGRGDAASLRSASHGAGRVMSRSGAKRAFTWSRAKEHLREKNVTLLSAGLDEVPFVYKDIHAVMAAQRDLVDVVARFEPRIVKMAPDGERPED